VDSILLGLVEGVTEFLPISSTGHLILVSHLLGAESATNKLFDIVVQLGAILAVCWLYRAKLIATMGGMIERQPAAWRFACAILLGFVPAMVLGAALHDVIKDRLFNVAVVAFATLIGGIVIILVERFKRRPLIFTLDALPLPTCLMIGCFQCLAMIPGTSRSGATIIGALLLNVDRRVAAEYSFFLAIPTMFAATFYDLYKTKILLTTADVWMITIGFVTAFIAALVVVRWLIGFLSRHDFTVFGWYRIVLGIVMLVVLY